MKKEDISELLGQLDDAVIAEAAEPKKRGTKAIVRLSAMAASLLLTAGAVLYGATTVAEAKEYRAAVAFFEENHLSAEGLSREDVKAVYRDILERRFTYEKTALVICQSVQGWEIEQKMPTASELEALWERNRQQNPNAAPPEFQYVEMYAVDEDTGVEYVAYTNLYCYRDGEMVGCTQLNDWILPKWERTKAGTAVWGINEGWSSEQKRFPRLACLNENGAVLWETELHHGFQRESIEAVLENSDGTWAVIGTGDRCLCLTQVNGQGRELSFHTVEVGNDPQILGAVNLRGDYLIRSADNGLIRLNPDGTVTDTLAYEEEDRCYVITDMTEYSGKVYLSAYAYPKQTDEGGRDEIAGLLDYVENCSLTGQPLDGDAFAELAKANYTAVLLVCDPDSGTPHTFYSVKAALGDKLAITEDGSLTWDVLGVLSAHYSPYSSSFSVGVFCETFRYTFDASGTLIATEDLGIPTEHRQ